MYRNCQTEAAAVRQQKMEEQFLELLGKCHYDDITVCRLCQYMQVPRKTFYRYFSGKDGVLYALIDHSLAQFFLMPRKGFDRAVREDLKSYFLFWYENRNLLDALQRSGLSGILVERANRFALKEGHIPKGVACMPPYMRDMAVTFSVCGLMSMVLQWHRTGFAVSPEEMTGLAVKLLSNFMIPAHGCS